MFWCNHKNCTIRINEYSAHTARLSIFQWEHGQHLVLQMFRAVFNESVLLHRHNEDGSFLGFNVHHIVHHWSFTMWIGVITAGACLIEDIFSGVLSADDCSESSESGDLPKSEYHNSSACICLFGVAPPPTFVQSASGSWRYAVNYDKLQYTRAHGANWDHCFQRPLIVPLQNPTSSKCLCESVYSTSAKVIRKRKCGKYTIWKKTDNPLHCSYCL